MSSGNFTVELGSCPAPAAVTDVVDGDTAWLLVAAALVLLQTPGVGLFYGGLVRRKNMVNTMFLSFAAAGVVAVQWVLFGYSLAFGNATRLLGNFNWGALRFVSVSIPNADYAATVPHLAFANFQMMFAIITPALISGAVVERVSTVTWIVFVFLWTTLVYDPLAHWLWSAGSQFHDNGDGTVSCEYVFGWLRDMGAIDFAGGTVIHISSGVAGLVASYIVGRRHDVDLKVGHPPANIPIVLVGVSLIWFGWLGFNGGSAGAANSLAVLAATNTTIAAGAGFLCWLVTDLIMKRGRNVSVVGASIGVVVGLVAVTPASGYILPGWSILFGVIPAWFSYFGMKLKHYMRVDDSLDVFFCHGIGGIVGALMTGLFSSLSANPAGAQGAFYGNGRLFGLQLLATVVAIAYSAVGTAVILLVLKYTIGLKASEEGQQTGMDKHAHDEEAFHDYEQATLLDKLADQVKIRLSEEGTFVSNSGLVVQKDEKINEQSKNGDQSATEMELTEVVREQTQ